MAAEAADIRDFVRGLFQGSPDLSVLTHAIVRKRYLAHTGQTNLTKEEKEQLKLLVEEELVQMKVDDSPGSEVIMTEALASVKPGGHKRPLCVSSSSSDEVQSKQEQKKQRRRKKLDVGSDEDSGIDSKKIPVHDSKKCGRESSETSDQEDLGTETHTDGSGSDGLSSENKRKVSPWKARGERQKGSKAAKQKHGRRQEDTSGSESDKDAEGQESDVLEVIEKHRKATKGQSDELESDSEWEFQKKKGVGKEKKQTRAKAEGGMQDARRRGKEDDSEEESKTSKRWEILRGKRVDSSGSEEEKKWDGQKRKGDKRGQRIGKAQEGTESEDESEPDLEFKVKKKITNSKQKEESVRIEELGSSSSEGSWDRSQIKKGTPKGKTRGVSKTKLSHTSESDSEDKRQSKKESIKKTQRKNGSSPRGLEKEQEAKKPGIQKPKRTVTSEDSESETDEGEGLKQKSQGKQEAFRSEGESTSETEEGGKGKSNCRKGTPSSSESESGSSESESENQRRDIGLKKKDVSESESSQEEEMLKKRGGEKSQRLSKKDSEDSKSKLVGRKKSLGQLEKEKEKLRKRVPSKDVSGNESVNEEESSSSGGEDNPTASKQQHQGKGEEHPSIRRLKRYIRECGVHRNYKKLFAGCRSRRAQVEILKKELESLGMKGTPSLAKCKALKQKREEAAEVASLDINNIIATEGRPRRRNVWSLYSKPQDPPSSPEELPTRRPATDWSRLRGVISSDGESS